MYTGKVCDENGLPIPKIKVSDGKNIAITNEAGEYALAGWERARVISVQTLTMCHDDWYRYIDADHSIYNFHLTPCKMMGDSSFIQISDTEIFLNDADVPKWINFVKNSIQTHFPNFIIHTGDICFERGLEMHKRKMCSENMGIPVRYTIGNHDYVKDKYGEYTFERLYGPIWYSFELGNIHYVILPISYGDTKSGYAEYDCIEWLENDLENMSNGMRPIIFCHQDNLLFERECAIELGGRRLDLKKYNPLAWIFGHLHQFYIREIDGRFHIGTARPDAGGIDATPAALRIVKASADTLESTVIYNRRESNTPCEATRVSLGSNICFTEPIYADESIFISTFTDGTDGANYIYRISKCGDILWKRGTKNAVKYNMAYDSGVLYATDNNGTVYVIDSACGNLINSYQIPKAKLSVTAGGITLHDGTIYAVGSESLYAYKAKNGELIWESEYYDALCAAAVSSPLVHGDKIFWGKNWRGITCIDRANGKTIWHNDDAIDSIANPALNGSDLYVPTRYRVCRIDSLTGQTLAESIYSKKEAFCNAIATPIYHDQKIYVPTCEAGIVCYDAKTLKKTHSFDVGEALLGVAPYNPIGTKLSFGKPIIENGELIFTACDGKVYFYNINTYELKRTVSIGHPLLSGVVKTDDGYCVSDFDGGISFIK